MSSNKAIGLLADRFVSESLELRGLIKGIVDAAKRNDAAGIQQLAAKADALGKETDALGTQLGAPACAEG